jgi:tRNA threonylcarbamoyladenosine biosynthesis protein TsaE
VGQSSVAVVSSSEQETYAVAKQLAESLPAPAHILLYGDLGAGKTVFAKGLADGFGVADVDEVSSPTFTLINQYSGRVKIYHIDLYRIQTGALDGLGLEEIFDDPDAFVIIEWAERLGSFETPGAVRVFLSYIDSHSRRIDVC